jgi:predicted dehydrogenase
MLRVGIVGCGNIFDKGYLPALSRADEIKVLAVCDQDPARSQQARDRTGARQAYTKPGDLFKQPDLDAVFILTPTDTHADLTIQALKSGRHVLCEKPMARSLPDARRMAEVAQQTGKRLMVGHTRRFDDRWLSIREQVRTGRLGDLLYIFRSEHGYNGAPAGDWKWQSDRSGGVLWDVGIHAAELFEWFFGERARQVYARLLRVRPEARGGGGPDGAVVQVEFDSRKQALFSVSWFHPPQWAPFYATMDLVGTSGKLSYLDRNLHSLVLADPERGLDFPRYSPLLSALSQTFTREISHFARAVADGTPFTISIEEAESPVAIMEAADRSAESNKPEEVRS